MSAVHLHFLELRGNPPCLRHIHSDIGDFVHQNRKHGILVALVVSPAAMADSESQISSRIKSLDKQGREACMEINSLELREVLCRLFVEVLRVRPRTAVLLKRPKWRQGTVCQ